jgi:lipopolysaccharide export system permease protein
MKKLIFRKFINDTLIFFIINLLILSVIVLTIQAVNYFDFVTEDGHGLKTYFIYTFLNIPKIIYKILPFVFFISLFYTIISYETNNQLNIFWLNGVSKLKFCNVVFFFSILILIIQIFLGAYVSPLSQLKARKLLKDSNIDFFSNLITDGKFINAVKGLTIFTEKKNLQNFSNIFIDDSSKDYSRMIYAKSGLITGQNKNKKFILYEGEIINIKDNKINIFKFEEINFDLLSFGPNTIVKPKVQETSSIKLLNCFLDNNLKTINNCSKDNLNEVKEELLSRFVKPMYIPIISILATFLLFFGKYNPKYTINKNLIFLLIFLTIVFSESLLKYSAASVVSLIIYILTPIVLMIISYCLIYTKINNA